MIHVSTYSHLLGFETSVLQLSFIGGVPQSDYQKIMALVLVATSRRRCSLPIRAVPAQFILAA